MHESRHSRETAEKALRAPLASQNYITHHEVLQHSLVGVQDFCAVLVVAGYAQMAVAADCALCGLQLSNHQFQQGALAWTEKKHTRVRAARRQYSSKAAIMGINWRMQNTMLMDHVQEVHKQRHAAHTCCRGEARQATSLSGSALNRAETGTWTANYPWICNLGYVCKVGTKQAENTLTLMKGITGGASFSHSGKLKLKLFSFCKQRSHEFENQNKCQRKN
eukprot:1137564-Pelagomonas_calceolata.AAC.3